MFLGSETIKRQFFDCVSLPVEGIEDYVCFYDRIYPIPFLDVLGASAVIATIGIRVGNRILTERGLGERVARKSALIANVVLDALDDDYLVQITNTRGKIYVGWILLGPGISRDGKLEDVAIAPLYSGHRHPTTQEMIRDIDYSLALDEYRERVKKENRDDDMGVPPNAEMSVVIPMGEIALIRRHNEDLEEFFFPMGEPAN